MRKALDLLPVQKKAALQVYYTIAKFYKMPGDRFMMKAFCTDQQLK